MKLHLERCRLITHAHVRLPLTIPMKPLIYSSKESLSSTFLGFLGECTVNYSLVLSHPNFSFTALGFCRGFARRYILLTLPTPTYLYYIG